MSDTTKQKNMSARDLINMLRANIQADHHPADEEDGSEHAMQEQPSLEPAFQLAALAGVREDAKEDKDFYGGLEDPPFCWHDAERIMRDRLKACKWDMDAPMDADVKLWISRDRLEAWCLVLPPVNGGKAIDPEHIQYALEGKDIEAGLVEDAVKLLSTPEGYLQLTKIAQGRAATRGENGYLIDLVSPSKETLYEEDEKGRVDFAERNWIINVEPGQRLCEIVAPTEGENGFDVYGNVLPGRNGRPLTRVNGPNTQIVQDGRYLVATEHGQAIRTGDRFTVTQVLTINGNIDYSTGNIRANGSVIIYGNVMPTFHVQAKYDVIIHGSVEGATVIAGRDLTILGGVMASREGFVHAGHDLKCKFMENGRAYSGGDAYFENLILCEVSSEGSIYVTSGRGSVVGGSLVAMGDIHIGTLGNRTYRTSQVRIQGTQDFLDRKSHCSSELEDARDSWKMADENVSRLETYRDNPQVSQILSHQESLMNLAEIKITNLKMRLDEFTGKERDMETRRIYVKHAFPNGNLGICGSALVVHEELRYAIFALKKGALKMVADR